MRVFSAESISTAEPDEFGLAAPRTPRENRPWTLEFLQVIAAASADPGRLDEVPAIARSSWTEAYHEAMSRRPTAAAFVIAGMVLAGCATGAQTNATPSTRPTSTRPLVASRAVTKVLVVLEENHSLAEMRAEMPYAFGLASEFGYATHYTAVRHPSLPNYIAITGGQTYGITNDDAPANHPIDGESVFGQAIAAGKTAAVYAEGMQSNCATSSGNSSYAVKHNPWVYYAGERSKCQQFDLPIEQLSAAITSGTLPKVGMVIPNLCHDAHNCTLRVADAWLTSWMTKIFDGPDWRSGHLAVVLTADEDDNRSGNVVLTAVLHPSQKRHVVTSPLTHYSLTRLYEDVIGVPYLFNAATAPSMAETFGLPLTGKPQ